MKTSHRFSAAFAPVVLAIAGILSLATAAPALAMAAPREVTVKPADLSTDPATTGGWLIDDVGGSNHGTVDIATPTIGGVPSARLHLPSASDKATLQYRYAPADIPTFSNPSDLTNALSGAAYTISGTNVNYQLGIFYTPNDVASYGPAGTSPCSSAGIGGDWCYTTIKYEPYTQPVTPTTVTVAGTFDQGYDNLDHAGWWRSKRVGQYAAAGSPDNVSLNDMLAEMSEVKVYGFGVSIGPAYGPDVTGWVQNLSFAGTTYSFAPDDAAAPPFPDSGALDGASVPQATDFEPVTDPEGSTSNLDLSRVNPDLPLYGELTWSGLGDTYVDVYTFSAPVFVGTFPVVGGKVQISANLSGLPTGAHSFLFIGQTSGTQLTARFTVITTQLAATGSSPAPLFVIGLLLLLAGGALGTIVWRARRAR